jgi:CHAT domain-containing protein
LRGALEPGAGLARFCLARRPPKDDAEGESGLKWEECYYACVLGTEGEPPRILDLGSAKEIEDLVLRLRQSILGGTAGREYVAVAADLRRRILDPILSALPGVHLVLLVPEGELHFVPFLALCTDSGEYLAESGPVFHVLGSELDLLPSSERDHAGERDHEGAGLLALGDPDFGRAVSKPGDLAEPIADGRDLRSSPSLVGWPPLPQTRAEIEAVAGTWKNGPFGREKIDLLEQSAATERAFRRDAKGRRVIHLATHGYYEDSSGLGREDDSRGLPRVVTLDRTTAYAARTSQLPFLRSGLVFAGGGALRSGAVAETWAGAKADDDGIMTTEEVLGLDLSGVEWVVLSACDTGLGEIRHAEGVLGLRRAFRMAGARTVIGSLWPVEDRWAREWMEALYRARFLERLSTADAVRAASLTVLSTLRKEHLEPLPRRWASFSAVGDWH